ncbi:MAG: ABC transporter ATP-binding protein [Chloroflexi bacterium]|nr:ABC transporter ATP-binding protein [Chloroflexota bacterium]
MTSARRDVGTPAWAVETRSLSKAYDHVVALRGVDLAIRPGERVAVFGRNGAGKTTLIKLLAGLFRPSAGSVRLWGRRPWGRGVAVRARVGLVTHQSYLYEELSPWENLLFYARLYGTPDPPARVEAVLEGMGLGRRARDPVRTLSRGMQQRVAVARALVHDPSLLLLDEPDTGLDPAARAGLADLLARGRADLTVLVSTHNLAWGVTLCSRSAILTDGRLTYDSQRDGGDGARSEAALRRLLDGAG